VYEINIHMLSSLSFYFELIYNSLFAKEKIAEGHTKCVQATGLEGVADNAIFINVLSYRQKFA